MLMVEATNLLISFNLKLARVKHLLMKLKRFLKGAARSKVVDAKRVNRFESAANWHRQWGAAEVLRLDL